MTMTALSELLEAIEVHAIEFVDFRVVDLAGRLRHVTIPATRFSEDLIERGIGFDASNYGYRRETGSDMVLLPDLATAYVEQRAGERILSVLTDIVDAVTREPSELDPRGVLRRALDQMRTEGIADDLIVGPELEFYVFETAVFDSDPGRSWAEVIPYEGREHRDGDLPGRGAMSAYHAPLPYDRLFGLRNDMVREIEAASIPVKYHHHEVGPHGQLEIELGFGPLLEMADATVVAKSIIRNVASERHLTATFMPKPIYAEAGSGLHLHQYLVQQGRNLFQAEDGLTEMAHCYVGGLLSHGRSLMGITNPSTNSYRRLVPGYEAPVHFTFGAADRTAAVRLPTYAKAEETRIELRTMDATCNPYLAFAAVLMAGLDGVRRGLDASALGYEASDGSAQQEAAQPPRDLHEALQALAEDRDYLTVGGVYSEQMLAQWRTLKQEEVAAVAARPHPHEFMLYYDL